MTADAQPILELRGVNKSFGVVHVLHDVDFQVYPGQVTALVGDNGAAHVAISLAKPGDILVIAGKPRRIERAERYLLDGY